MDVYERMAELYDLIYCDRLDLEFYLREAQNSDGPVLEVACGTGRILLSLLEDGIEATGMDISSSMIEVLRRKADELGLEPDVHVAEMMDFDLGKQFSLITVPYRSFLHLKDDKERKKALKCFMAHLKKGGRLILHTYNPSEEELSMTGSYHTFESERLLDPEGNPYELEWYLRYDPKDNSGHYKIAITLDEKRDEFKMHIYYVQPKDMRKLLSSSGFRNIKVFCGFDYSAFEEDCSEVIWIAEK